MLTKNCKIRFLLLASVLLIIFTITASAHSGKTDYNGGHYNSSTGDYHYHHGYPEHSHYDMDDDGKADCPYTFKEDTKPNENKKQSTSYENTNEITFKRVVIIIFEIIAYSIMYNLFSPFFFLILLFGLPILIGVCKKIFTKCDEEKIEKRVQVILIITLIFIFMIIIPTNIVLKYEGIL